MTADDKISLFAAVLGCSTARTCAKDLPKLLTLKADRSLSEKDEMSRPDFFHRESLKDVLLRMFSNIRDGTVENWASFVASKFNKTDTKYQLSDEPLTLTVTFEVDANYVQIRLGAAFENTVDKSKHPLRPVLQTSIEFGRAPTSPVAGYSRHTREISYERLKGWGTCLTSEVA